jgi:hypothetical protein
MDSRTPQDYRRLISDNKPSFLPPELMGTYLIDRNRSTGKRSLQLFPQNVAVKKMSRVQNALVSDLFYYFNAVHYYNTILKHVLSSFCIFSFISVCMIQLKRESLILIVYSFTIRLQYFTCQFE